MIICETLFDTLITVMLMFAMCILYEFVFIAMHPHFPLIADMIEEMQAEPTYWAVAVKTAELM